MQPHQQRVVEEKNELDEKLSKLSAFIDNSELFFKLSEEDQDLLGRQEDIMKKYSQVLRERIQLF